MMKAFKYPLYPTEEQELSFIRMTGACRWVWNYCVKINQIYYESNKKFLFEDELKKHLPILKKLYPWLKEVPAHALQNKIKDYDKALRLFLKYRDKVGFPSFCYKKEDEYGSFRINQVKQKHIKLSKKNIVIPKIDEPVEYTKYRKLEGRLLNITVKYEHFKWWVICCCDDGIDITPIDQVNESDIVGIDLGIKTFAVLSDERNIETNKFLHKKEKKLKRIQKRLARKEKSSKNRLKNRKELNKLHRKIANQRYDFLHKTSTEITNQYKIIGVEDLNIKGMIKNHKLAKAIQNQGWGMFLNMLIYKSLNNGNHTIKIDRWAPSTKTCSDCHQVQNITLDKRTYICANCGLVIDRDLNASLNIKRLTIELINRMGTIQINYIKNNACGDTYVGESLTSDSSYVSSKQENRTNGFDACDF